MAGAVNRDYPIIIVDGIEDAIISLAQATTIDAAKFFGAGRPGVDLQIIDAIDPCFLYIFRQA